MQQRTNTVTRNNKIGALDTLESNSVIRNTYILLSMTLAFSAIMAYLAMAINARPLGMLPTLLGFFGLFYLTNKLRNSVWGIAAVFAFTGFLGFTLGPMLNAITHTFVNGSEIIAASFGLTGAIFLALSGYALTTRKDFSYLGGFLFVAITVIFIASLMSMFFQVPALQLAISSGFVLISSGYILYETSQLIHGGERNYIMATISLYVQIYNLFISLLHILSAFTGRSE